MRAERDLGAFNGGGEPPQPSRRGPVSRANNGTCWRGWWRMAEGSIRSCPALHRLEDEPWRSGRLLEGSLAPEWSVPELWLTLYYPPYESGPPLRVASFSDFFETYVKENTARFNHWNKGAVDVNFSG